MAAFDKRRKKILARVQRRIALSVRHRQRQPEALPTCCFCERPSASCWQCDSLPPPFDTICDTCMEELRRERPDLYGRLRTEDGSV